MTIRTNGHKIPYRIEFILFPYCRNGYDVVNMNKSTPHFSIYLFEIHTTDCTLATMSGNTLFSSLAITFISIDYYLLLCTFEDYFRIGCLIIVCLGDHKHIFNVF